MVGGPIGLLVDNEEDIPAVQEYAKALKSGGGAAAAASAPAAAAEATPAAPAAPAAAATSGEWEEGCVFEEICQRAGCCDNLLLPPLPIPRPICRPRREIPYSIPVVPAER